MAPAPSDLVHTRGKVDPFALSRSCPAGHSASCAHFVVHRLCAASGKVYRLGGFNSLRILRIAYCE
eukprot:15226655-Alexandrium_andersonii.AAC.1